MDDVRPYDKLPLGAAKQARTVEVEPEQEDLSESDEELDLGIEMDDEEIKNTQNKLMEYCNIFGVSLKPTREMREIVAMNPSELHVANLAAESQIAQLMDEGSIQRLVYLLATKVIEPEAATRLAENSLVILTIKALTAFKLVKLPGIVRLVLMLALNVATSVNEIPDLKPLKNKKRK